MKKIFCIHKYNVILSTYHSFNFRNVVVECEKCKKRKEKFMHHDNVFPFPTSGMISNNQFNEILENGITPSVILSEDKSVITILNVK